MSYQKLFGDPFNPKKAPYRRSPPSNFFMDLKKSLKKLLCLNVFQPKKPPPRRYSSSANFPLLDQSIIEPLVLNIGDQCWKFKAGEWVTESHILPRENEVQLLKRRHVLLKKEKKSLICKGEILLDMLTEKTLEYQKMTNGVVEFQQRKNLKKTRKTQLFGKKPSKHWDASLSSLPEFYQNTRETELGLEYEHPVLNIEGQI
ncbi:protein chibby homolog 1-like isoform X3 [Paralichthys olivaceus]|uniref:protein chibby homolog 1-like isoform X3 n=1 Tax=Paralichthys olivaceus TaxID=8255 RepID=UPI003752EF4C